MYRVLSIAIASLALSVFVTGEVSAKDHEHEGLVVKAADGKLTMTYKGKTEKHTHEVAKDAKITLDGKAAKLEDLKEGNHVKVTAHDEHGIVKIEAHSKAK